MGEYVVTHTGIHSNCGNELVMQYVPNHHREVDGGNGQLRRYGKKHTDRVDRRNEVSHKMRYEFNDQRKLYIYREIYGLKIRYLK